ncbi:hypothetical protein [Clostridium intestinale]|uniref:hypothetical protein n=1 Tax=Clostridium intestinale TaxID=36845 RepID=UPI002DD673B9|nr:hypothetical protein [Clostridium intestinale]WRY50595.1 hypothetical protein P8F83_18190 [Clostridium intestinale]
MDELIRKSISEIIKNHTQLVSIAIRQRAKFEGWLKFELADHLQKLGMSNVEVESNYVDSNDRADLGFAYNGIRYDVELKTPNANWRIEGIENKGRPITKNITSIIIDTKKLEKCVGNGIIAFVLFPVPVGDNRWIEYLSRISNEIGKELTEEENCSRVKVPVDNSNSCEVIICCFNI